MPEASSLVVWNPPGRRPLPDIGLLLDQVHQLGGQAAMPRYCEEHPCRAAYVHGERHDLWWEFALSASFRWQARVAHLPVDLARRRTARSAADLGLRPLLSRPVESLTRGQRAKANLAVALLPLPALLLWEEPMHDMDGAEGARVCRFVRDLCRSAGLTVVAFSADPHGLHRLASPSLEALRAVPGEY